MSSEHMNTDEAVVLPASFVQELLWLMDRASPGSSAYNVPRTRRLVGPLNVTALRRAFDALVERHEILRTTYAFHEEHPVQVIHPARPVEFIVTDLRDRSTDTRVVEAERIAREQARKPFDLAKDQIMRVAVLILADDDHVLHIDSHHIAFDGWSRDVLFRELSALYREYSGGASADLPTLPIQYADYAIWEREHLAGERLEKLLGYWRTQLGDAEFVLELPTDYSRPSVPGFGGVTEKLAISPELLAGIKALGRQYEATTYMTLLAAYTTVLHRYTGQRDVLVGSPIAGRSRSETEGLIGYFANTIVQRARFGDDPTFADLLAQVRSSALGAYDHQEIPFEKLVLELQGGQQLSHSPLFQVVFTMLGGGNDDTGPAKIGDAEVQPFGGEDGTTKFDLTLFMTERGDSLTLTLRARSDLYSAQTVSRMLSHLRTVLETAVANPQTRISEIELLTIEEKQALVKWNATTADMGAPATIDQLFAAQAVRVPDRTAVASSTRSIPYQEVDARSNQLANYLRSLGVKEDSPVAITLDRSAEVVVAILGVLKAGGAYVPVLPDLPIARAEQQIVESGARVVITVLAHESRVPSDVTVVRIDADSQAIAMQPMTAPAIDANPDRLAYVLFTSGSTGVPKGVAVTHRNVVHYARAVSRVFGDVPATAKGDGFEALDGWQFGMVSTLGADLGNTSLFPSLFSGGTLHILSGDVTTDPSRFNTYVTDHPLDVLKITPNHLRALVGALDAQELMRALPRKWIVLGGEALSWDFAQRLLSAGSCRVLNHYGPTETTVGVSTFEVTRESAATARDAGAQTVPIGNPLRNVGLHVLDADRQPLPVNVPGELYISGDGVTRGYLRRDDLTAERFVDLTHAGRAYRSGDRVRRLPDGSIEFLGRADDQVKIRGYRVELSEIEHVLAEHPGVAHAVALIRTPENGESQLVAYVVPKTVADYAKAHAQQATPDTLHEFVVSRLPDYMVPAAIVMIEQLPLSANGKIDRNALPDPTQTAAGEEDAFVAPRTATEEAIALIWADVLKKERVGVTENFITLGGHSLLAIRVLGKLSRKFGVRLPLRSLFDAPTIAELAELVDLEMQLAAVSAVTIKPT
ncbi:MAG: amino acid adenylation domain-containing protein [bacterium]